MFTVFEMALALFAPGMLDVIIKIENVFMIILKMMGIELPAAE